MQIQYYFAPQSPWTYLGHERFCALARAAGAQIEVLPTDYGRVFPQSGGLPLPKRAPQRQAYRLVELKRFSSHLKLPLTLHPRHFPVAADPAARLIVATDLAEGADAALRLTGAVLRAVWVQQRDIADAATLTALLAEQGLPAARLAEREMTLEIGEKALDRLAEAGFDPVYGARPLKRAIQQQIENPLAQEILKGRFGPGAAIRVDVAAGALAFS